MRKGAGEYRDRVTILTRTLAAADVTGEEVESWPDPPANTGEHWARIESVSGGESVDAPRASYHVFTLRFRHEVELAAIDRVRMKDTELTYSVTGVWRERRAEGAGFQTVCTVAG